MINKLENYFMGFLVGVFFFVLVICRVAGERVRVVCTCGVQMLRNKQFSSVLIACGAYPL